MPEGNFPGIPAAFPAVPPGVDEEIICYCAAVLRLRQASDELHHDPDFGSRAERDRDRTMAQLRRQQGLMVRHMVRLRAQTREAHRQRALVLDAWIAGDCPSECWGEDPDAMAIVKALVRDLLDSPNSD